VELILVIVGAIVVTAMAHRRGLEQLDLQEAGLSARLESRF
jgi:hypothetical protein